MTSQNYCHFRRFVPFILGFLTLYASHSIAQNLQETLPTTVSTTLAQIPSDFTQFELVGQPTQTAYLNFFLWYHFINRFPNTKTLFNKEYLTLSDMWLSANDPTRKPLTIQRVHRQDLLAIQQDAEGYISSHQHPSHAHDLGWPFPLWVHPLHSVGIEGHTAGWHFRTTPPDWEIIAKYIDHGKLQGVGGQDAIKGWKLENLTSQGIVDNKWKLKSTGPSPTLTIPETVKINAAYTPFLQLRWTRSPAPPPEVLPYVEWMRESDTEFSPDRRILIPRTTTEFEFLTGTSHTLIKMYRHPLWKGSIKSIRFNLAPGESGVTFNIDSLFTTFDTRHTTNNPIFILASWNYFLWSGDVDFLMNQINRMRMALRFMQVELGGIQKGLINAPWAGHSGHSGYQLNDNGTKTFLEDPVFGDNYWDILPTGGDNFYATAEYYAALLAMADAEQLALEHPDWPIPFGALALNSEALRKHAQSIKEIANVRFWNEKTGRFYLCIDRDSIGHDYGYTFVNLNAIWYDIATAEHAQSIIDWLNGTRIVQGDSAKDKDIYTYRFGPRASTLRNVEWYPQAWPEPEKIPWGGQVQDGGAVLGFTFFDLWARNKLLGPDNAWERLDAIFNWLKDVWQAGGYRNYYDGKRDGNATLQGGGTSGGIGIDQEFSESSLLPAFILYGFMGIRPTADGLEIIPNLPSACPKITVKNLRYHNEKLDIHVTPTSIQINLAAKPIDAPAIKLAPGWKQTKPSQSHQNQIFTLDDQGQYDFIHE